jgi:hypothetical protein
MHASINREDSAKHALTTLSREIHTCDYVKKSMRLAYQDIASVKDTATTIVIRQSMLASAFNYVTFVLYSS